MIRRNLSICAMICNVIWCLGIFSGVFLVLWFLLVYLDMWRVAFVMFYDIHYTSD